MSPLVAYHATRAACRESIRQHGLLPTGSHDGRPFGVYVFRPDSELDHPCKNSACEWECHPRQDLWETAYIGPLAPDQYVLNAVILFGLVDHVTLVTSNLA